MARLLTKKTSDQDDDFPRLWKEVAVWLERHRPFLRNHLWKIAGALGVMSALGDALDAERGPLGWNKGPIWLVIVLTPVVALLYCLFVGGCLAFLLWWSKVSHPDIAAREERAREGEGSCPVCHHAAGSDNRCPYCRVVAKHPAYGADPLAAAAAADVAAIPTIDLRQTQEGAGIRLTISTYKQRYEEDRKRRRKKAWTAVGWVFVAMLIASEVGLEVNVIALLILPYAFWVLYTPPRQGRR